MAIIRHIVCTDTFRAKKIYSFLVLISPRYVYPNSIQSHKGGFGFPTEAQAKGAGTFSIKVLYCKGKQNIKRKDTYHEKHLHSSESCYCLKKKSPKAKIF